RRARRGAIRLSPHAGLRELRGAHGYAPVAGGARGGTRAAGSLLHVRRDAVVALPPPADRRAARRARTRDHPPDSAGRMAAARPIRCLGAARREALPLRRARGLRGTTDRLEAFNRVNDFF